MKTLQQQIIEKQDEIIEYLLNYIETYTYTNFKNSHVGTMLILNELSALKQQAEQNKTANSDKELFEKVYIRSEADLPKIEDVYYVHIKSDNKVVEWFLHKDASHQEWLKYVDWYLRPVEAEQEKVTDSKTTEEIPFSECWRFVNDWLWDSKKFGQERKCESMNRDQCHDAALMIKAFMKLKSKTQVEKEKVTDECCHPYAFVYRKGDYERCDKCGKILCEG